MSDFPSTGTDIRLVRQWLDSALLGLREIRDPEIDVSAVERFLGDSLAHCYEALRASGSYESFRNHSTAALELSRQAIAELQQRQSEDPEVARNLKLVARALSGLASVRMVTTDDASPIPNPDGIVRATVGRPVLLRPPRLAIRPTVPLDTREAVEEPPPPRIEPIPPATSIDDVRRMMEDAKKALAALAPKKDGAEEDDEEEDGAGESDSGSPTEERADPEKVLASHPPQEEERTTSPGQDDRVTPLHEELRATSPGVLEVESPREDGERATMMDVRFEPAKEPEPGDLRATWLYLDEEVSGRHSAIDSTDQERGFDDPEQTGKFSSAPPEPTREPVDGAVAKAPRVSPSREFDRRVTQMFPSEIPARLSDVHFQRLPSVRPAPDVEVVDGREVTVFGSEYGEDVLITRRAEELLFELAAMGRMRRPSDELTWLHGEETERRLLTRLDALIACGEWTFPHLVRQLADRPVSDPDLVWGLLFLLGCIDGEDSLDQMQRIFEVVDLGESEVDMWETVADALVPLPHPGLNRRLVPWLDEEDVGRRRVAVTALSQRRALTVDQLSAAARDDDLDVVAAAAHGLGLVEAPLSGSTFTRLLRDEREPILRAAMASALAHRREAGLLRAIDLCREGRSFEADAGMFLAVGGTLEQGHPTLLECAATEERPDAVRALGWLGHPAAIEFLIGRLGSEEDGVPEIAAAALERITGARLTKEDPDPEYAEDDTPFLRKRGQRFDILPEDACLEPEAWSSWWKKWRRDCEPNRRYRFGHRWEPIDNFEEMSERFVTIEERFYLHLELVVRTGGTIPLDAHAFVDRQLTLHSMWPSHLHRAETRPGSWPQRLRSG